MEKYSWYDGYKHLCAGLCCGMSSLAAGYTIGLVGDLAVRKVAK